MAWNSKGAAAMAVIGEHLSVLPLDQKLEFRDKCARNIFQDPDNTGNVIPWERQWGITIAFMGPRENLIRNLEFAMIQELLGLGPPKYCLVSNKFKEFDKRVLLVLNYLPQKKICMFPPTRIPRGPFEAPIWEKWGKILRKQRISLDDFIAPETWKVNKEQDMMCVRFTEDEDHLVNNVKFALLKENLGIGPKQYCLVYEDNPNHIVPFAIVTALLPRHKMFVYPGGVTLDGMFENEPWLSRGVYVCSRASISKEEFHSYFPDEA